VADKVQQQMARLHSLTHDELKALYVTMFGSEPPTYNRTFIINRLAYRIQEFTFGGLSETVRDRLRQLLIEHGYDETGIRVETKNGRRRRATDDMPIIGTKLIREWKGARHEVIVVPGGVEYQGKRYRSLTAVTRAITGCHWNGRTFFGIDARGRSR